MAAMRIGSLTSTDLFCGTAARPLQIVRVQLAGTGGQRPGDARRADPADAVRVRIEGPGVTTPEPARVRPDGAGAAVEVGVAVAAPALPGSTRQVTAIATGPAERAELTGLITVAEAGWTMWMISHFHYDPVWWSTQGQFLESRLLLPGEDGSLPDVRTAFELVRLHLDAARRDPDYKFVLAEIDYLKPHFDAHPEDRADLLAFIAEGRIELVGGSYNEPNTNLTSAESTIRNAVYGLAYQRAVLGGDPRAAWMLDAFGFDPGYPGLMAAAGLADSSWARGPFHQWGPNRTAGDNRLMQFASEFEWLSPSGAGLLTSYMANHYSAGWGTQQAADLPAAEQDAYRQFSELAPVAATRNVLLPVGGDHVIPSRWATAIHRDWNARYLWPRFVTAVPSEFFAAVRAESTARDIWITPQTRDMNPVYTGKDVSYIDTKQGQRAAETAVEDGERLATLAWLAGADYPAASLDKAWRLLAFGAHHDAITGTEGDQVYLDLLAGWREAYDRGDAARRDAIGYLAALADTASLAGRAAGTAHGGTAHGGTAHGGTAAGPGQAVVIMAVNTLSAPRSGLASTDLTLAEPGTGWIELRDDSGAPVPFLAGGISRHPDGSLAAITLTFRARDVPAAGYRAYLAVPSAAAGPGAAGWQPVPGAAIENDAFLVRADPARGGTLSRVLDKRTGTELLAGPANELVLQEEYATHPRWGEGPWLLCPKGPGTGSAARPARLRAERCPIGSRLVAELELGGLRVTQETLLWDGADRVEFRTHVDGAIGQDRLLRVAFPARVPGGLPVYQTALSVIGRPPGSPGTDVAEHSFTLDNPAHEWFALGSTARVSLAGPGGQRQLQAIGVAELITPAAARGASDSGAGAGTRQPVRDLLVALARQGVTATCSAPDGPRYGAIEIDSNLPDVRISLGGPEGNAFTAAVLRTDPAAAAALDARLASRGTARVWVPASQSRAAAFAPGADLRGPRDLPVLIIAGADLDGAVSAVIDDLADAQIEVEAAGSAVAEPLQPEPAAPAGGPGTALAAHTVALLNRGTPSSLVTPEGTLTIALMRACSSWPCGVWIDGEPRTVPDGSSFAWQHWSHTFEYALAAGPGDWRSAGFALAGLDYNHDLLTARTGLHAGPLPARASLASAEPPAAALMALKPRGNPLSPGAQPSRADGVTMRLRDLSGGGTPVPARVRLFTALAAARASGLCEDTEGDPVPVADGSAAAQVPPAGVVTLAVTPLPPSWTPGRPGGAAGTAVASPEPAQPVYSRYWLHGKGPAPAGNLPVAVHLSPERIALDPAGSARLRLTVAGGPEPAAGKIALIVPPGLSAEPAGPLGYDLPGNGQAAWELTVRARPGGPAGRLFLAAQITDDAGQLIEDAALVTVGEPAAPRADLPLAQLVPLLEADQQALAGELDVTLAGRDLTLRPGEDGAITAMLVNRTASPVRGEAQLISPFGSWVQVPVAATGFAAEAGAGATVSFAVTVPGPARPGQQWWAILKIMYFGRIRYAEPVLVTVAG
jgi:alpha-mannosidase